MEVQVGRFYENFICEEEHTVTQLIPPENFILHKQFKASYLKNDMALIKLKEPLTFNTHIQPVSLPDHNHPILDQDVITIGWALTRPQDSYLQHMELRTYDRFECNNKKPPPILFWKESEEEWFPRMENGTTQICVKAKSPDSDSTCYDNSGGPLLFKDTKEIMGVLSGGSSCTDIIMDRKSYYTLVTEYLDWIEENTGIIKVNSTEQNRNKKN